MICKKCGSVMDDDSMFCEICGAKAEKETVEKNVFCGHCGTKMTADAAFCPVCGSKTGMTPTPAAVPEPNSAPNSAPNPMSAPKQEDPGVYCRNCGIELFKTDEVCPSCGKIVDEFGDEEHVRMSDINMGGIPFGTAPATSGPGPFVSAPPQKMKPKKSNAGLIIAIVVSLIVIAGAGVVLGMALWGDSGENSANETNQTETVKKSKSDDEDEDEKKSSKKNDDEDEDEKKKNDDEDNEKSSRKDDEDDEPTEKPRRRATEEPTDEPTEEPDTGKYLYNTHTTYITEAYLDSCTQDEVRLILNEMYARHGYIFKDESYRQYFMRKDWYTPRYDNQEDAQRLFNSYEEANRITIIDYEVSKGWR